MVMSVNGDGDFLMNGQEFATAVQYALPIIVIVCDNASYGTIRMHQERHFPGRVVATDLRNPDFGLCTGLWRLWSRWSSAPPISPAPSKRRARRNFPRFCT